MKSLFIGVLAASVAVVIGCAASVMEIRRDNPLSKEVFIVASSTKSLQVGKNYMVYRTEIIHTTSSGGGHAGHGGGHVHDLGSTQSFKKMVGMIEVTKIIDDGTASAKVLNGDVLDGDIVGE